MFSAVEARLSFLLVRYLLVIELMLILACAIGMMRDLMSLAFFRAASMCGRLSPWERRLVRG